MERYVTGLLTNAPRKNCKAIAQAVANTSLEQLQHLLTDAAWDPLALNERGWPYVCAVTSDFGVRLFDEMEHARIEQAQPATKKRGQPKKPRPALRHDVKEVTEALPEEAWQIVEWREGSWGALRKQFVALRCHAGTRCARHSESHGRSWTGPEGWLLAERPLSGEEGQSKWFFSCLPAETPLIRLVELAHLRWPVEQFYEGGKGECGLDHFQGHSWKGLHCHLALVMLAYTFLMLQSLSHEGQTDPAKGAAFSSWAATKPPGLPSAGARLALPGCSFMAH